mmetsp:Transcript_95565/g.213809  ORF Transcript_95565/g.213809 Transcript_95565/m.213809 type:complete len:837 (-) Transcript_95565:35-2545(-)
MAPKAKQPTSPKAPKKDPTSPKSPKKGKEEAPKEVQEVVQKGPPTLRELALTVKHIRPELRAKGKQPPTALIECLEADEPDVELVEKLVKSGQMNLNLKNTTFGWTPLHYAANHGSTVILQKLLAAKADVSIVDRQSNTPLHLAARSGHVLAVRFLTAKLSDSFAVDGQNSHGWTALTWAVANGYAEITEALLEAKATVDAADSDGRTVPMWAAKHGHTAILQTLLEKGFALSTRDRFGLSVADHAQDYVEMKASLLEAQRSNEALLSAVTRNDVAEVGRVLEAGADLRAQDDSGWDALAWSMVHQSADLVRLLAKHGADRSALDAAALVLQGMDLGGPEARQQLEASFAEAFASRGRFAAAARAGDWETVRAEVEAGATTANGREEETELTGLMFAAIHCDSEAAKLMVKLKASPNLRDCAGWTAAHFAVQSGSVEMVSTLMQLKADFQAITHEGATVQHLAARGDDSEMVDLLAKAQCVVTAKDAAGATPLQVAAEWGSAEALSTLIACRGELNMKDHCGRSLLFMAVASGHEPVVRALLELPRREDYLRALEEAREAEEAAEREAEAKRKAKAAQKKKKAAANAINEADLPPMLDAAAGVNGLDNDGQAPLALAALQRHQDLVSLLLEQRAELDAVDSQGNTALMLAAAGKGGRRIVETLLKAGASRSLENEEGETAESLAEEPLVALLLQQHAIEELIPDGKDSAQSLEERTVFRIRLEGVSVLPLPQEIEEQVVRLLRRLQMPRPLRVVAGVDPITARPQGYAYVDFVEAGEAKDFHKLSRHRDRGRDIELYGRRLRVLHEGARIVALVEGEELQEPTSPLSPMSPAGRRR